MKKMLTGSLVMVVLFATANAFADDPNAGKLTTKGYVDAGLDYLYQTKQDKITSQSKLDSDLVDDTNSTTHKFVSQSEKTQITTNATDIGTLQTTIGTAGTGGAVGTGLVGRIETLEQSSTPGAISGLQSDVADLQSDVSDLQTAVGAVGTGGAASTGMVKDIEDLQDDVSDLQGDVTQLQTDVQAKQDTIDSNNKLDADLVDDTNSTHKFITAADKTKLDNLDEYVAGDGITITDSAGADLGKKVISVDSVSTWVNPWVTP